MRVHLDDRDQHQPGFKYADWEMRGVPLRLEVGPKDIEKDQCVLVRRDTREKAFVPLAGLGSHVTGMLVAIQKDLLERARRFVADNTTRVKSYDEFKQVMAEKRGFILAGWCGDAAVRGPDQGRDQGHHPGHPDRGPRPCPAKPGPKCPGQAQSARDGCTSRRPDHEAPRRRRHRARGCRIAAQRMKAMRGGARHLGPPPPLRVRTPPPPPPPGPGAAGGGPLLLPGPASRASGGSRRHPADPALGQGVAGRGDGQGRGPGDGPDVPPVPRPRTAGCSSSSSSRTSTASG